MTEATDEQAAAVYEQGGRMQAIGELADVISGGGDLGDVIAWMVQARDEILAERGLLGLNPRPET